METITSVSGIPLHYARSTQFPYGTPGRPASFPVEPSFNVKLNECFDELFDACPLGKPNIITCAGIYNPNHWNENSRHRVGKAFDFDAAFWDDHTLVTQNFHHNKELYLGIECYLRIYFGIVLNYFYDQLHEDHWHFDDSVSVDYRTNYKSSTLHLQLVLTHIYRNPVVIDGIWGDQTKNAIEEILEKLDLTGRITTASTYKAFLRKTGKIAFKRFEHSNSPATLLNNVYETMNYLDLGTNNRTQLKQVLNEFRDHHETQNWLQDHDEGFDLDSVINSL